MKKDTELKPLSEYEHDAMWMSYRYAIGRHTVAAIMHAGRMIQNVYGRLSKDQAKFDALDIRREIANQLLWHFNFGLNITIPQEYFDPFKALIEFEKTLADDEKEIGLLNYLNNHHVNVNLNNTNWLFEIHEPIHPENKLYETHLHELLNWANAANALDPNKHHMVTTKFSGKEKTYDAFETITYSSINGFRVNYTGIDIYLENPFVYNYISEEFITNVDGKSFVFGKDKVISN